MLNDAAAYNAIKSSITSNDHLELLLMDSLGFNIEVSSANGKWMM